MDESGSVQGGRRVWSAQLKLRHLAREMGWFLMTSPRLASSEERAKALPSALRAAALLATLAILVAGCGGGDSSTMAASSPTAASSSKKAGQPKGETVRATRNAQVADFSLSLDPGASATIQFGPTTQYGFETSSLSAPVRGGRVDLLVAGMLAHTTYHMRSVVQDADGSQHIGDDHAFTTGGLPPARLPQLSVARSGLASPVSGIELLGLVPFGNREFKLIHSVATDLDGNLIWYYDSPGGEYPFPIKLLPNGHMLLNLIPKNSSGFRGLREIDLAGRVIQQISLSDLNSKLAAAHVPWRAGVIHHDFLTLPNGHLIVLVNYIKPFHNLRGFGPSTSVVGDALVDLNSHRKVVWTWSSFAHLDVNHHPLNFPDWTHSNAVIYSPDDGDLIVSMRDEDWVMKIAYENGLGDGHILWKLGPGGDFTLVGGTDPTDWNYAQHYPTIVSPNSSGIFQLGLMDNGNGRKFSDGSVCGTKGAPPCYSRAVIFQLDENAHTATLVWQDSPLPYSMCCGNTDLLNNGDIEFNLALSSPIAMVEEVTQQNSPSLIWEMTIAGQLPYRAFRMPSLYPGVQW